MGQEVSSAAFSREDRQAYRHKVLQSLDIFEHMLEQSRFDFTRPQMGLEIELNLVDSVLDPALINEVVLAELEGTEFDFQAEVGRYNIEMNAAPDGRRPGGASGALAQRVPAPRRGRCPGPRGAGHCCRHPPDPDAGPV